MTSSNRTWHIWTTSIGTKRSFMRDHFTAILITTLNFYEMSILGNGKPNGRQGANSRAPTAYTLKHYATEIMINDYK